MSEHNEAEPHDDGSNDTDSADDRVSWHPAFFQAIKAELDVYGSDLHFAYDHHLSFEPLRIDVLIIKKARDVPVRKNIASIFRRDNIVEYKSPDDYVSVRAFHRVYAYACLYAAEVRGADITELTLTFIGSGYPRELLSHLQRVRGYAVEEKWPGIYILSGGTLPIQVIDSRRLSADEYTWLKGLDKGLDADALLRLAGEMERRGKTPELGAYLYAVMKANKRSFEEALKMGEKELTLDQILENAGLVAKWEARAGEKFAMNLLNEGFSHEQTARLAELDIAKVRELAAAPVAG